MTNGLLAELLDGGAENWSKPPGSPKVFPPDCLFVILSASSSGSARRLFIVAGLTGCVENAEAPCTPDRKAITPAISRSVLLMAPPFRTIGLYASGGSVSSPLAPIGSQRSHRAFGDKFVRSRLARERRFALDPEPPEEGPFDDLTQPVLGLLGREERGAGNLLLCVQEGPHQRASPRLTDFKFLVLICELLLRREVRGMRSNIGSFALRVAEWPFYSHQPRQPNHAPVHLRQRPDRHLHCEHTLRPDSLGGG